LAFLAPWANLLWGGLALLTWLGVLFWHARNGFPFSFMVLFKGFWLLGGATAVYQMSTTRKHFFLGMFPLLWLASSRFQWELCSSIQPRFWAWVGLFLVSEVLLLVFPDGKKLLWIFLPLWAGLIWLFKFSFLMPLAFLTAPKGRFQNSNWIRWGGVALAVLLFLLYKGWFYYQYDFLDLYEVLISARFISFFLLGWLGLLAFSVKGPNRHLVYPMFSLLGGFLFWTGNSLTTQIEMEILQWVLVFMAGFGLESIRKDLLDPTWHGCLVWFAIGVCFFQGVI
jgi:hypothetical protein